jgi:hypothetical protein
MKNLLESISNNTLLEQVINLLSDLPEDDNQSIDI